MTLTPRFMSRALAACSATAMLATVPAVAQPVADPHFGLDLNRTVAGDSIYTQDLGGSWTYHHVYPLSAPLIGTGNWQPDTDFIVQTSQSQHLDVVLTVHSALAPSLDSSYPADTLTWKSQVQQVVERYDGDHVQDMPGLTRPVKYWHVEQEMSMWTSTWPLYVTYLGATRRAILAADPTARIVLIGLNSAQLWGEAYRAGFIAQPPSANQTFTDAQLNTNQSAVTTVLQGGGYDIVDVHSYEEANILHGKLAFVRSLMPNPSTPIWCEESGGPYLRHDQGYSDTLNAQMVVRLFAEALGSGVERYNWYLYQFGSGPFATEPWNNMSLTLGGSSVTSLKPSYYAYQQMVQKLAGFTSVTDLTTRAAPIEDSNVFRVRFLKGSTPIDIYWSRVDSTIDIPVNAGTAYVTHIPTRQGETAATARIDTLRATAGLARLRVTADPVYVEEGAPAPVAVPAPHGAAESWCRMVARSSGGAHVQWRAPHAGRGLRAACVSVDGRQIREWRLPADAGTLEWDGRLADGRRTPAGLYLLVLRDDEALRAAARAMLTGR